MLNTFTSLDYQLIEMETEVALEHCINGYKCADRYCKLILRFLVKVRATF